MASLIFCQCGSTPGSRMDANSRYCQHYRKNAILQLTASKSAYATWAVRAVVSCQEMRQSAARRKIKTPKRAKGPHDRHRRRTSKSIE